MIRSIEDCQRCRVGRRLPTLVPVALLSTRLGHTDHGARCEKLCLHVIELIEHQGVVRVLLMSETIPGEVAEEPDNLGILYVDEVLAVHHRGFKQAL